MSDHLTNLERAVVDACIAMATVPRVNGKPDPEKAMFSLRILDRVTEELVKERGGEIEWPLAEVYKLVEP